MESNDTFGTTTTGSTGTTGTGSSGMGGSSGASGSDAGFSRDTGSDAQGLADRAKSAAGSAGEKLSDVGSTVRDKAGSFKDSLADALSSGADRLRQQGGQVAGATGTGGSTSLTTDDSRIAQTSNQIAGGMQGAADWLRDADLDGLKTGLEKQVKDHPGRTLAVAVGVGYLLGKAFRK
ncbi:MAG: hypothetical protein M3Z05_04285 [Gemmatimonadota bacterium]|nr:hypothetical protein [Gemmatimonadota bacterium]